MTLRHVSMAAALALLATPALADHGTHAPDPAMMTITAQGTASAVPDRAIIQFSVENAAPTAAGAMALNTTAMTAVFETMSELGIEREDIATSGLSLNPRYRQDRNSEPRILGYQVSNRVAVTARDMDGIGGVLDAIVGAGANSIGSISFSVSDTSEMEAEARRMAAELARAKARDYAEALGTEVLGVRSVSEGPVARPYRAQPMMMARAEMASAGGPVPISASDVDVQVTLSVVFELSGALD